MKLLIPLFKCQVYMSVIGAFRGPYGILSVAQPPFFHLILHTDVLVPTKVATHTDVHNNEPVGADCHPLSAHRYAPNAPTYFFTGDFPFPYLIESHIKVINV